MVRTLRRGILFILVFRVVFGVFLRPEHLPPQASEILFRVWSLWDRLEGSIPLVRQFGLFSTLFLACAILEFADRPSPRIGVRVRRAYPVRAKGVTDRGTYFAIRGKLGRIKTEDCRAFRLLDFAQATTSGWLKKLLCVAIFGGTAAWLATREYQIPAAAVGIIGLVVFVMLLLGHLHVVSSTGHASWYFAVGCAHYARYLASIASSRYVLLREASAWTRREVLVNPENISVLVVGRKIRWAWILFGAALIAVGALSDPAWIREDLRPRVIVAGTLVLLIGVVLSLIPLLWAEFVGGGRVAIERRDNIEKLLELKDTVREATWHPLVRMGILGDRRYLFNARYLGGVHERRRIFWPLILVGLLAILLSISLQDGRVIGPGADLRSLWPPGVGFALLAIGAFLSRNHVVFQSQGGFQHSFRGKNLEEHAGWMR